MYSKSMQTDPVALTEEEISLLQEREFFFARKAIRAKLRTLLGSLREALLPHLENPESWAAPEGLDARLGQLAGGEYYRDMPYVYLDLPKYFSREATFDFRWMAWWGHYIFFAFLSHGQKMPIHAERLLEGWEAYCGRGLFLGQSEDPWDWRAEPGVVMPVAPVTRQAAQELLARHHFLKLMKVLAFDDPAVAQGRVIQEAVAFFNDLKPLFAGPGP